jgi:DNA-binding response OmpR family regulator
MKVLTIEDDVDLVDLLTYALSREGYTVIAAIDGAQGLQRWEQEKPDLVILDAQLPKVNGFEICQRIRRESNTPVIMLTARDEDEDIVRGLTLGADDYMTKPFSAKQLAARMKAVLRRSKTDPYTQPQRELTIGDLTIDLQSHEARRADHAVQLTSLEFRILHILAMNAGRVIPYARLVEYGWGYEGGDSALLKTHICHIREKLKLSAGRNGGIRAIPRVGYSLNLPVAATA